MEPVKRDDIKVRKTARGRNILNEWYDIGVRQFKIVLKHGLDKNMKYLDIGCGDLRGGIHIIKNIENGNYYGVEVPKRGYNQNAVLRNCGLSHKTINMRYNRDFDFEQIIYDRIMAWSVFTHLTDEQIIDCIEKTSRVMGSKTKFLATRRIASKVKYGKVHGKNFTYPISFFEDVARDYCLSVTHIKDKMCQANQSLLIFEKKE